MKLQNLVVAALVLALPVTAQPAWAQQASTVVSRVEIDQALAQKTATDEGARDSILALLARPEVRAVADEVGLDVRRAAGAVSTLQGEELARVANQASAANDMLAGGQSLRISLVALLLIVIIVILLVD